jgi:hypothetical protein
MRTRFKPASEVSTKREMGRGFGYPDGVGHSGKLVLVEAVGALLSWL